MSLTSKGMCVVPVSKLISGKLILNHDEFFGMVEEYGARRYRFEEQSREEVLLDPKTSRYP